MPGLQKAQKLDYAIRPMKTYTRLAGSTVFLNGRFDYVDEDSYWVSCRHHLSFAEPPKAFRPTSGPAVEDLWRCSVPDKISTSKKREAKPFTAPKLQIEGIWYVESSRKKIHTHKQ